MHLCCQCWCMACNVLRPSDGQQRPIALRPHIVFGCLTAHTQAHIHMHAEFWIVYWNDSKVQHRCSCLFISHSPLSYTGFARGLWGSGLDLLSVRMPGKKSQSSYFWMFPQIYVDRARFVGQNPFQGVLHEEHAQPVHLTCATRPITCWPKPSFHILIGS